MVASSRHFRLEPLAPGVCAAIAEPDGHALCNAGIVDLGGSSLVFDAMLTPEAGAALGRAAEELTGGRVGLLVNSHYHGDHVRGNAAVGAVHVVSTRRTRDLLLERGRPQFESDRREVVAELAQLRRGELGRDDEDRRVLAGWFEGIAATPENFELRPPDLTFEEELVVHGPRRSARILTFGGGHSPSDTLVYLPEDRIVFLGDLLSVGFHPSLSDGEPEAFVRILDRVRALGAEQALPGHGPVGGDREIGEMRRYITSMLDLAGAAKGGEGDAAAPGPARLPAPFDRWLLSTIYEENVRFVLGRAAARRPPPG